MTKNYFFKIFLLFALFCQFFTAAQAQNYAIGGTAGSTLTGSVFWLNWDNTVSGNKLISAPNSYDPQHITNGTYVWQYSPTVRITAIISNESFVNGITMQSYTPGNFTGDGLDLLYSGNNLPKPGSRGVAGTGMATTGNSTAKFDIDVKVAILINGVYTDVVYPGMVIGDAESIDSQGEFISGDTPNPVAWQLLNKRTQNDPSDSHYLLDLSNGGRSFKLHADLAPGNFGVQAVMFAHGARNLTNLTMLGSGITAMAIGFVLPFDLGDAPSTYGTAGHYIDDFAITDFFAGDGTYPVVNYNTTPLTPKANVFIGADNVDADGDPIFTAASTNDDLNGNNDESTLNPNALADIKVNQPGSYTVTVPVTNRKNIPATLYGWIDFNGDGVFAPDELITATVPANTNNQNITLTYPNSLFTNKIKAGLLYARLRVTTTALADDVSTLADERATNFAADGEAEDYKLKNVIGVTISGTVHNDGNGNLDNAISGTGLSSVSGSQLYAYLVSGTAVIDKVVIPSTGIYSFADVNNGTYIVAISTNNVVIGSTLASVSANLPLTWVASGEAYGTNNSAGTGIETGTPNLQITVATPGSNLDVSGLDFGIDRAPVAVTDNVTAVAGGAIPINVLANDTDADGTIDITSVRVVDPADNVAKTTVTIPNQGTYVVNTTTGIVTFTPLVTFSGASTPVTYTIKDNYGAPAASNVTAQISVAVRPKGTNDADVTLINTPVTTNVKSNDGTANAGATVTAGNGTNGTTTVDASGQVTYTPTAGFTGTDTYTYTLTNGALVSDPITVTITVSAVPIGVADNSTTTATVPVTTNVLANDGSFANGSTVNAGTPPAHGSIVVNADRTITYTPNATYTGKDTYTYTITKNGSTSALITVTISVVPVAVNDNDVTVVNTAKTTAVKTNEPASATGTTVTVTTAPAHGATTVNATGQVTYTPTAGYTGIDTYAYTLTTADGLVSAPATVTIRIAPVAVNDAEVTTVATAKTTAVKTNDQPAASTATVTVTTQPANGTTTVDGTGQVVYTPNATFTGIDTYAYTLTTPDGVVSAPATVTVRVAPVAVNDAESVLINTAKTTTVKQNDLPATSTATVTVTVAPQHGTAVVNATGQVVYTPAANYLGTDTYSYTLTTPDGVVSAPATVSLTVSAPIPVGTNDTDVTTIATAKKTTVLANDADAATGTVVVNAGTAPADGTIVVNADNTITYTPTGNYMGSDTYTYTYTKNGQTSAPITVTMSVKPVAVADNTLAVVGATTNIDVRTNDQASGVGTTLTITTQPSHGTVTVNAGGSVSYTPTAGYTGPDTFSYKLTSPDGLVDSDPVAVTLNVTATPVGLPDTYTTTLGTAVSNTVRTNDPTTTGTISQGSTTVAHGTLVLNANGTFTYTPTAQYAGKDTFTYLITANGQTSAPVLVTLNVKPTGAADNITTATGAATPIAVRANDATTTSPVTITTTTPAHGTATVDANGLITYTPTAGYNGPDTFTYIITTADGVASDPITVNVTVSATAGVADLYSTNYNTPRNSFNVKANDGASAAAATVTIQTAPAHGTASVNADNTVNYTPQTGYVGLDTYTYILTNGATVSAPVTVTVQVKPVGTFDGAITGINQPITTNVRNNDGASAAGTTVIPTNGTNGTTTVDANGVITYTPATNFTGTDTYTYVLKTADGVLSDPISVTVTVKLVGQPDALTIFARTAIANTSAVIRVKDNDGVSGSLANVIVTATNGAHGTTSVDANGIVTYVPALNYIGVDTYTYTLSIPGAVSDPITVTVTMKGTAQPDAYSTNINTSVTYPVKQNDGALNASATVAATNGAHGTTTVQADGQVTYKPDADYIGIDTYTYNLTLGGATSDPVTVTVTVKPHGTPDDYSTTPGNPAAVDILTNDGISATGATVAVVQPANGAVILNTTTGIATYTPKAGYVGTDTYTYTLTKNGVTSDPITVTVHVKPAGVPDEYFTKLNTALTKNVRDNDGSTVATATTAIVATPTHGTATLGTGGQLIYTPATGYVGMDNLTYTLTINGETTDPISVKITVFTTGLTLTKVATNTVSKVGDVINYAIVVTNTGSAAVTNVIVSDPGADAGSVTPAVIPTLAAGASANVTAKHTLTQADVDAGGYVNQATVVATDPGGNPIVGPPSDDPSTPAPGDGTTTTITPNTAIKITKTGVADINTITYTFVIENVGNTTLASVKLTDTKLGVKDSVITVPAGGLLPGNSLTVTKVYTLTDADKAAGKVDNTASATGTDTKGGTGTTTGPTGSTTTTLPAGPVAADDAAQTSANQPVMVYVLDNDKAGAAAIDKTSVVIVAQPGYGTVTINADGTVVYTPGLGYPGIDTFTYKVKDANGYFSNVATVTISGGNIGLTPPTLFTPNGDGINDTFEIRGLNKFAVNELEIVNRWGNQVYKATNYQNTWTGEGLNEGTYYYILRLKVSAADTNWITIKGWTTLLRTFKR